MKKNMLLPNSILKIKKTTLSLLLFAGLISCSDEVAEPMLETAEFTVMVENNFEAKDFFASGTTGFIMPGASEEITFYAGKGHYFQFATMYVQSNDLFFAPADTGIPLFDEAGNALTGDITDRVLFWDAGTEVNEEPGTGMNQAPRQSGPNTGEIENGTVRLLSSVNDGFSYPGITEIIRLNLEYDGSSQFTLRMENTSNNSVLPSPVAPGTWVVHSADQKPMFAQGEAASPGLENIAEDGNNALMDANLSGRSGLVSPFAPGAYSIGASNEVFSVGTTATTALKALAEDGSPAGFAAFFNTPEGASGPAPIFSGERYSFTFTATEGDQLSLATMLVQSNDWFIGLDGIPLFNNGVAIDGDITDQGLVYDAATEMDEFPGAGNNQAPRQNGPNSGVAETGAVVVETNLENLPEISKMLKITIQAIN